MAEPNPAEVPPPEPIPPPVLIPDPRPADEVVVLRPADGEPPPLPGEFVDVAPPTPPPNLGFWAALVLGGTVYVLLIVRGGEARRVAPGGAGAPPFFFPGPLPLPRAGPGGVGGVA